MMSGELCVIFSYRIVHHVLTFQANVPLYPCYTAPCKYILQTHIVQMYLGESAILCILSIHHVGTHHANVPLHTGHCFSNLLQPPYHAHAILRVSYYPLQNDQLLQACTWHISMCRDQCCCPCSMSQALSQSYSKQWL